MGVLTAKSRRSRLEGISEQLWTRRGHNSFAWRLSLPEDSNDRGMFLPEGGRSSRQVKRRRLFHYIAAGGLRQTRVHRPDRPLEAGQSLVMRLFLLLVAVWVLFRFVPCD